jgi:hypothetical protein
MRSAIAMGSVGMINIQSFMPIVSGLQVILRLLQHLFQRL